MNDYSAEPWNSFPADARPEDKVSEHFRLCELTRSELADRQLIDNTFPSERELRAAVYLCRQVLEPIRQAFGPFSPNSVFRSQALERTLKKKTDDWLSTSQHTLGCACDIEIAGQTTLALAQWASTHLLDYDQIICECYDPSKGPNSGWVHISLCPPGGGHNRRQLLSYIFDPSTKRYVYVDSLKASFA